MHPHPLHRDVTAECLCCGVRQTFYFTAKSDQVVCSPCTKHLGSDARRAVRRDQDHVAVWKAVVQSVQQRARQRLDAKATECAGLTERLQERDAQLAEAREEMLKSYGDMPSVKVQKWVSGSLALEAEAKRDQAYRSRDWAMKHLLRVEMVHHDIGSGKCFCGERVDQCRVAAAIEDMRDSINRWEQKQIRRARDGYSHYLPDEHPVAQETQSRRFLAG